MCVYVYVCELDSWGYLRLQLGILYQVREIAIINIIIVLMCVCLYNNNIAMANLARYRS